MFGETENKRPEACQLADNELPIADDVKRQTALAPATARHQSLLDGLIGAGVKEPMMGIAAAGYANTVGAALEDTSLPGTCFLEHEWDIDGDRTFVLKVNGLDWVGWDYSAFHRIELIWIGSSWRWVVHQGIGWFAEAVKSCFRQTFTAHASDSCVIFHKRVSLRVRMGLHIQVQNVE